MRLVLSGLVVVAAMCACGRSPTAGTASRSDDGATPSTADSAVSAPAEGGWELTEEATGIDGRVLTARKVYEPSDQNRLVAEVVCAAESGRLNMAVESYLGDPQNPSPRSAFATDYYSNAFGSGFLPVGRVRTARTGIRNLSELFAVSSAANNRIEFSGLNRYGTFVALPANLQKVTDDELNLVRALKDLLPITLEVNTGGGKSEVTLEPADPVLAVLDACGGARDLVPPSAIERLNAAAAAEEQEKLAQQQKRADEERAAAEQTQTDLESARVECETQGQAVFRSTTGSIDCAEKFPDELAQFNSRIDAIYAQIEKHPFRCDASKFNRSIVARAIRDLGAEQALADAKQRWCGWK